MAAAKEHKANREAVLATLAETALPPEQLALLRSTSSRGQRETKRQRLRRALQVTSHTMHPNP